MKSLFMTTLIDICKQRFAIFQSAEVICFFFVKYLKLYNFLLVLFLIFSNHPVGLQIFLIYLDSNQFANLHLSA